ncbi:ankyrin repeat domain-containing protein [Nocardia sp. NPDC047038]|uniref:ankyrin repeat domain-containing protein n=1 Tax=Nocardia sp. NPDC047038 TaxID=3154338 RepID=UPI0034025408
MTVEESGIKEIRDEHGWRALDRAAAAGDTARVRALLDAGADPRATGQDGRSAYEIAAAAGQVAVARLLRELTGEGARGWRPYCRAYTVAALREFPGWSRSEGARAADDTVVFLHDDLSVTRAIWPGEEVLWSDITPEWSEFCARALGFAVPDELDLVASVEATDRP